MKIRQSIENALAKAKEKRGVATVATIRRDVVERAIKREEFESIKCAYHYTDDYLWDMVNEFGQKKSVSAEALLKKFGWTKPDCWVDPKTKEINGKKCYEISISFHSNLAYDMYVPVA
jgi:hypothetical protein